MRSMADESRELDRLAARAARTAALRVIPLAATVWVAIAVLVEQEDVVRIASVVAIVLSVLLGARAAVTAKTFVSRWLAEDELRPPPLWVTLAAVAGAVATMVAGANVAADITAGRSAVRSLLLLTVFVLLTLAAIYQHVGGGHGLATALRAPEPLPAHPDAVRGGGVGSAGAPEVGALRMLLVGYTGPDDGAAFRRDQLPDTVAAAGQQLRAVRARRLDERGLAQVVTLLGCSYDPTAHGSTYSAWLGELERTLLARQDG